MDDAHYDTRDSRGFWRPSKLIEYPPVFVWPANPAGVVKWLFGYPGYLWPWNSFYAVLAVLDHNEIPYVLVEKEACCGMPKLELGDLDAVERLKRVNIPPLAKLARDGYAILTAIPSCTLMFKAELPLLFPDDADVKAVAEAMFDPFEYFVLRNRDGLPGGVFTRLPQPVLAPRSDIAWMSQGVAEPATG